MLHSNAPFVVVCPFDPAIDDENSDVALYTELRDMSLLKFHPDMEPTRFYIRRVGASKLLSLESNYQKDSNQYFGFAFMAGVIRVDNLYDLEGTHWPTWYPAWKKGESKSELLTSAELDLFPKDESIDIGSVVAERANLRKGRPTCFVPPPSSASALGKKSRASRRVEQADLLSKKQSEVRDSSPETTDEHGAQPGPAIAKGESLSSATHTS